MPLLWRMLSEPCMPSNFSGARIPIQTKFSLAKFKFYLEHYQDRITVDFLRYGWPINYMGSLPSSTFSNHPSAAKNSVFLRSYVHKELVHRSICGPFTSNPFDTGCVISPLLCVPKRDSDELRLIHDLSFPEGFSVNDGIAKDSYLNEPFRLRLPGIDRLVEFVNKEGRGCHVFKKDLRADVCKYRPEAYKSEKLKNPKKIHRVALVELLSEICFLFRFDDYY